MFKIYQDDSIRSLKEYEMRLREVVNAETTHFDIRMNGSTVAFKSTGAADTSSSGSGGVVVRKRYLYLRSEVEQGKQPVGIPLNQQLIDNLYRPVSGSTFHAVASTNSIVPKSLRPSPPGTPAINKQASARPPPPHPHPHS
jgi:hypothetical protein